MANRNLEGRRLLPASGTGEQTDGERELYDTFGVASDEEEGSEDGGARDGRRGVEYHDDFLEDPTTAITPSAPYRDNLPARPTRAETMSDESGDGSWQDAGDARVVGAGS